MPADSRTVATFGSSVLERNALSDRMMSGVTMAATSQAASIPRPVQARTDAPFTAPSSGPVRRRDREAARVPDRAVTAVIAFRRVR